MKIEFKEETATAGVHKLIGFMLYAEENKAYGVGTPVTIAGRAFRITSLSHGGPTSCIAMVSLLGEEGHHEIYRELDAARNRITDMETELVLHREARGALARWLERGGR